MSRDVHGISTHKVYPPQVLLLDGVRSYRTFSPLPTRRPEVILCDPLCLPLRTAHPLDGMVLYVVRTFLIFLASQKTAIEQLVAPQS